MALSVVYHSETVQFESFASHVIESETPLPSQAVAVNVTVPAFLNATFPVYLSTTPISSLDDDHLIDLFVASDETAAESCKATPTVYLVELPVTLISETFF